MEKSNADNLKDLIKNTFGTAYMGIEVLDRGGDVIVSGVLNGEPFVNTISENVVELGQKGAICLRLTLDRKHKIKVDTEYPDSEPRLVIPLEQGSLVLERFVGAVQPKR